MGQAHREDMKHPHRKDEVLRVLPDLTQGVVRYVIPGKRMYVLRDGPINPGPTLRVYQGEVKERREGERVADAIEDVALRRSQTLAALRHAGLPVPRPRNYRTRSTAFYVPVNGNEAGPLFTIHDRATGVALVTCRGVIHHVIGEAKKFAESQGMGLADVYLRVNGEEQD